MKQFTAEYTDEALEQYETLSFENQAKILEAIQTFELLGTKYKNINSLSNGLFEIKPKGVRAYFKYEKNRIIIIGFITLKKTQKAPQRYIEQAIINIKNYLENKDKNHDK